MSELFTVLFFFFRFAFINILLDWIQKENSYPFLYNINTVNNKPSKYLHKYVATFLHRATIAYIITKHHLHFSNGT